MLMREKTTEKCRYEIWMLSTFEETDKDVECSIQYVTHMDKRSSDAMKIFCMKFKPQLGVFDTIQILFDTCLTCQSYWQCQK